jgi:hypothetical protein
VTSLRRQRIVLVAAAASTAALLLAAAALSPAIEAHWRLHALRSDPSRLEAELISDRPAAQRAVEDFVRDRHGQEPLLCLFLDEFGKSKPTLSMRESLVRACGPSPRDASRGGAVALWDEGQGALEWSGDGARSSWATVNFPLDPRRRERILALLERCVGRTFRHPELPGLEFQLQPVVEGVARLPVWPGTIRPGNVPQFSPTFPSKARCACFYRQREG